MKHLRLTAAALAALMGVRTAAASIPNVPSPGAHKTPAKAGPLHKRSPAKPKTPAVSSATRAQVEELMTRGNRLFDARDWKGAIDAYTQAIALDPKNASAHYNLAQANYLGVVDWAKAEAEYRIALSYDPSNKYYQDGLDTVVRRQAEDAVAKVQNRQYAEQVEAINKEGVAKFSAGLYSEAEQLFSRALQMQPANAQIRANLNLARQQIAAAEQRRQQAAEQQQQYEQQQRQYAYQQAQRQKNAEFFNTVTQGLALGQQIAEANRPPPPRPAPTYSSAPRSQPASPSTGSSIGPPLPAYRPPQSPSRPAGSPSVGGAVCFRVSSGVRTRPHGTAGYFDRYDYTLSNDCTQPITIELKTSSGSSSVSLRPGQTRNWFCTVGFYGNPDCVGGVLQYSAHY